MNLSFEFDSTVNSRVIDSATSCALYDITTEIHAPADGVEPKGKNDNTNSTTTIRDTRGPAPKAVAIWDRAHDRREDRVAIAGESKRLAEWLVPQQEDTQARLQFVFTTREGERYAWTQKARPQSTFELVNTETQRAIARSHPGRPVRHYLGRLVPAGPGAPPKTLYLEAERDVAESALMDAALLAFVVLETDRREQAMGSSAYRWLGAVDDKGLGGRVLPAPHPYAS
ncbi:hypothetical protein C8Q80DRAFT_471015 [Daedaleopsis nitida]|nr:hypothetical protein C8Q80DRAFT_471015 [Daedaleopsis nitida]